MQATNDNSERLSRAKYYRSAEAGFSRKLFKATSEFRAPKKGEWYLSGAIIEAYCASGDFPENMQYWIATEVQDRRVRDRRRNA